MKNTLNNAVQAIYNTTAFLLVAEGGFILQNKVLVKYELAATSLKLATEVQTANPQLRTLNIDLFD